MKLTTVVLSVLLLCVLAMPAALAASCDDYIEVWTFDANWNMIGYTYVHNHIVEWYWGTDKGPYHRVESWTECYSGRRGRSGPAQPPQVTVASPQETTYFADHNLVIDATASASEDEIQSFHTRIDGRKVQPGDSVPLSTLGLGTHVFVAAAFTTAGEYALVIVPFTVEASPLDSDTTPPSIALTATPSALWPPIGIWVPIRLKVTITDEEDTAPTWRVIGVSASDLGSSVEDLDKTSRLVWTSPDSRRVCLRAWKTPWPWADRVYTITLQGTDHSGNSKTCNTTVRVLPWNIFRWR